MVVSDAKLRRGGRQKIDGLCREIRGTKSCSQQARKSLSFDSLRTRRLTSYAPNSPLWQWLLRTKDDCDCAPLSLKVRQHWETNARSEMVRLYDLPWRWPEDREAKLAKSALMFTQNTQASVKQDASDVGRLRLAVTELRVAASSGAKFFDALTAIIHI